MMASMRDGSGDEYFILFNKFGAIIKGFAHESTMSPYVNNPIEVWKGILDDVPNEFQKFISEPAFSIESTTFCIWKRFIDSSWQIGNIDYPQGEDSDGLKDLLFILDGKPSTYKEFADYYYDKDIPISSIESIYQHKPLTEKLLHGLNEDVDVKDLQNDIEIIGYPV